MIPTYPGVLTRADLASGEIRHALSVKLPGSLLAAAWIYPAYVFDRDPATNTEEPYAGTLPMGARLAIPAAVDLAGLGLENPLGHVIARAAQGYGLIAVDRGSGGLTLDD